MTWRCQGNLVECPCLLHRKCLCNILKPEQLISCRPHFQINFIEKEPLYFDLNFTEFCFFKCLTDSKSASVWVVAWCRIGVLWERRLSTETANRPGISVSWCVIIAKIIFPSRMMASSNGNIFRVTGHLCGEFTGHRWIPLTKASDAELWWFL